MPRTHRLLLIQSPHSSLGTGHPGTTQNLSLLQDRFWQPGMANDIKQYFQGCKESPRSLAIYCLENSSRCPFLIALGHT